MFAVLLGAGDDRIQVAVSSCGFNSFAKYYNGNLKGWTSDRYMPRIASEFNNDPKKVPFDFDDVILAIAPRGVFAMSIASGLALSLIVPPDIPGGLAGPSERS